MALGVFEVSPNVLAEFNLNDAQILAAIQSGFEEANLVMLGHFDREITASKWTWPYPPVTRDIVSEGILRQSYGPSQELADRSGFAFLHNWNTRYAVPVHEGYVTRAGNTMPGRPWTKEPLERFARIFESQANRALKAIR